MDNTKKMNIGILGTGHIGKTLARKLSAAGHDVKVANSRGRRDHRGRCAGFGRTRGLDGPSCGGR